MPNTMFTPAELDAAVAEARASVEAAATEDGDALLANVDRWEVLNGPIMSVDNMDDEQLCAAVVADLVTVAMLESEGKTLRFTAESLERFLADDQITRVRNAVADPFVGSLLQRRADGQMRIDPTHFQDACDFCGIWPEGVTPLTHERVYYPGPAA